VITTDQVGAADDLIDPGVNGYVVPAGSAAALEGAMRALAGWTQEQHDRSTHRSGETLERCSFERGADGFVQGSAVALAHHEQRRRGRRRAPSARGSNRPEPARRPTEGSS
jgi:hypothetical protein